MIKVRLYGNKISQSSGDSSPFLIDTGGDKIKLRELIGELPGRKEHIRENIAAILVNGRNCIFADGMDTEVGDDDVVDVLSPVTGG